jgi:hypothetical protein
VDVDPVVREAGADGDDECDGQEVPVLQGVRSRDHMLRSGGSMILTSDENDMDEMISSAA